jgi:hypothetical protein
MPWSGSKRPLSKAEFLLYFDQYWKTFMPAVKTSRQTGGAATKKDAKPAKKPAPKTGKKEMDEFREAHEKGMAEIRKAHAETEKALNKAIGGLSNTMGTLVEHVMTAGLPQKFKRLGFTFDRVTTVKWADGENNIYTEIDGLLENGNQAMAVEVKTTLRNEDVDDHLNRMEKVRKYADLHDDKREFLSAIAATIVSKSSKEYALNKGLFVIEPAGEDVKITKPISAKVW